MDLNAFFESIGGFLREFGIWAFVAVGFAFAVTARRRKNGDIRSAYLVPGWVHDNLIEELEQVRSGAITAREEQRALYESRVKEYRDLYETEHAIRMDLDTRFREVNAQRVIDGQQMKELIQEVTESRKRAPREYEALMDEMAAMLGKSRPPRSAR